jgi:hypothetical protein
VFGPTGHMVWQFMTTRCEHSLNLRPWSPNTNPTYLCYQCFVAREQVLELVDEASLHVGLWPNKCHLTSTYINR